jgi:hypothetical protein
MHHPLRDFHHLWAGPVLALALITAAGITGVLHH